MRWWTKRFAKIARAAKPGPITTVQGHPFWGDQFPSSVSLEHSVATGETVTDFFAAIRSGELDRVKSLLDSDPSLACAKNEAGVSALLTSVYAGRTEIRDLLLERDAHP